MKVETLADFFEALLVSMFRKKIPLPQNDACWHLIFCNLQIIACGQLWYSHILGTLKWSRSDEALVCHEITVMLARFREQKMLIHLSNGEDRYDRNWILQWDEEFSDDVFMHKKMFVAACKMISDILAYMSRQAA